MISQFRGLKPVIMQSKHNAYSSVEIGTIANNKNVLQKVIRFKKDTFGYPERHLLLMVQRLEI